MSPVRLHPAAMKLIFALDNNNAVQRTVIRWECGAGV